MNLKDNLLKEIKTTIIGGTVFMTGMGMLVYEVYMEPNYTLDDLYPSILIGSGGVVITFAADKIVNVALAWLRAKFVKGEDAKR